MSYADRWQSVVNDPGWWFWSGIKRLGLAQEMGAEADAEIAALRAERDEARQLAYQVPGLVSERDVLRADYDGAMRELARVLQNNSKLLGENTKAHMERTALLARVEALEAFVEEVRDTTSVPWLYEEAAALLEQKP